MQMRLKNSEKIYIITKEPGRPDFEKMGGRIKKRRER